MLRKTTPSVFRLSFAFVMLFFVVSCAQKPLVTAPKGWIELTKLDASIPLDIRYATTNNFMKQQVYDCGRCFLRAEAAEAIAKANKILQKKGYGGLKMYDCYRPRPVQYKLWKITPDARYVANPKKGSMHNRGFAVDLTIVDKDGKELDFGTGYDDFTEKAHGNYTNFSKKILDNRKLLNETMGAVGLKGTTTEWWHFSWQGRKGDLAEWVWTCEE
ncbi:MAG: M15 family metallopeptidase [Saprospiraceae bacterium]|nr:M15 family metallopeptidase [Saprospiraceae bacterium]